MLLKTKEIIETPSIILFVNNCGFYTKFMNLTKQLDNNYVLSSGIVKCDYTTRYIHNLNQTFLIIEVMDKYKKVLYGDYTISLHNLFSGPKQYEIELENSKLPSQSILSFGFNFTYDRNYYLKFSNIELEGSTSKNGIEIKYFINIIRIQSDNSKIESVCKTANKNGKSIFTCDETDSLLLPVKENRLDSKYIKVEISEAKGVVKKVLAKGLIPQQSFSPIIHKRQDKIMLTGEKGQECIIYIYIFSSNNELCINNIY